VWFLLAYLLTYLLTYLLMVVSLGDILAFSIVSGNDDFQSGKTYRRNPIDSTRSAWRLQFNSQRVLFQKKLTDYWSAAIDSCRGNSKALWSKLRSLLQPCREPETVLTADDFACHFVAKIDRICASTATAPPPDIVNRVVQQPLSDLQNTTAMF